MGYSETTWNVGDVITAEKLNNLERGVGTATGLIVSYTYDEQAETFYADKTFGEIRTVFESGSPVYFVSDTSTGENYINKQVGAVKMVSYIIDNTNSEPSPQGNVSADMDWLAVWESGHEPTTLAELDACNVIST